MVQDYKHYDLNLKIISNQATLKIELDREKLIIHLCKNKSWI